MFQMTSHRMLIFFSVLIVAFVTLQQCWQRKSPSEKWLYVNEHAARDYAGQVLGPGRSARVPMPERLAGSIVTIHDSFVTFSPKQDPDLVLAFSPDAEPPVPVAMITSGEHWAPLRDGWYVLRHAPP